MTVASTLQIVRQGRVAVQQSPFAWWAAYLALLWV